MFDPHRVLSRNRYNANSGRILHAKATKDRSLVVNRSDFPRYIEILKANGLYPSQPPSPPSPDDKINIEGVFFENASGQPYSYPITSMTLSTEPTINLSSNTGTYGGGYIALFQDTYGNNHLVAVGVRSGQVTLNIENNAKCRYIYNRSISAQDASTFNNCIKGVYTNNNQTILSARSNELNFTDYARLEFS